MHYKKLQSGDITIEFHNNWLGEETVIVFGQVVSKKSSILGTSHDFNVVEKGENVRYILTTKVDANFQVKIDLIRNGDLVQQDVPIDLGNMPANHANKDKEAGLLKLKQYDLDEALELFKAALDYNKRDPEIYFHLACVYSIQENPLSGIEALQASVKNNLQNTEAILTHDMLAFLRMHPAFEDFSNSGFKEFDRNLFIAE